MNTPDSTINDTTDGFISHANMRELHGQGLATPLSRLITDHVRYDNRWWIADRDGWHLIVDGVLNGMLDTQRKWVDGNVYLGGS
ncbi:hypothetical protein [Micromonospora sp. NPDC050276]|uniref:hypothetical protein n=1 Tax=Micromonospora sp. NPDC050276 TaxID=3364278 RepID=UPI00379D81CD